MEKMKRTHTCGELQPQHAKQTVVLNGWVHRLRDHGGVQFINLRDRYGITQIVVDQDAAENLKACFKDLRLETCIAVQGLVRLRPENLINPKMKTGAVEIQAVQIQILSNCDILPFTVDSETEVREDLRLKYRYLDLRNSRMQRNIALRSEVSFYTREYLIQRGFYEIETPTFIKSTPEGARDFLVPSRLNPGKFYALPQSPQLYKQLLMVSGLDKYFQIARCYRDEDARGDRQPEFTQIDLEMSFCSREDIFNVIEGLMQHVFQKCLQLNLPAKFRRLSYDEAMNTYGSDKPDLRFDLPMQDFTALAADSEFATFTSLAKSGGCIKALVVPGRADYSRKQIEELEATAKIYGAKGLAWMKVTDQGLDGGVARFFQKNAASILSVLKAKPNDLILLVGDSSGRTACLSLGAVRSKLGLDLKLAKPGDFQFCWIIDFPMFEWNTEENRWEAAHHMFTMPQEQYLETMETDPGSVKGDLYDLVCNGYELASGSIRVHDPIIQSKIFKIVGFSEEEAKKRFGFLLTAFQYGPPPHGGIAPGLDRLVMLMAGEANIREVLAFPKNTLGQSPMDECPTNVDTKQLNELSLRLNLPQEDKQS